MGLIKINGAIGPATASYIARAIDAATAQNDECLIIQLDTPGGLLDSASEIVQKFYASKVPTVVYVAPAPARAGSAGVFITMAADVAAMAPHTRIGAAHPVELGASGSVEKTDDVMKTKNGERHRQLRPIHRRQTASQRRTGPNPPCSTAPPSRRKMRWTSKVIDFIADDMPDLLKQLDGREIGGKTLNTANATVVEIPMNPWEHFSQLFLRPEVMFILMLMVIYGIIGELSIPARSCRASSARLR